MQLNYKCIMMSPLLNISMWLAVLYMLAGAAVAKDFDGRVSSC